MQVDGADTLWAGVEQLGNVVAHALVAALVVGLAFLLFFALLLALLEVAGQFHNHLAGVAIAFDERIDNRSHLVQTDVHRRVGDLAVAFFGGVFGLSRAKANVALKVLAVIGELGQDLARGGMADVAVVVKACGQNSFVVGDDFGAQCGQDGFKRLGAQTAVAFGQGHVGDALGGHLVHTRFGLQPCDQPGFVFFGHQLHHDGVLPDFVKADPLAAKKLFLGQHGTGAVAFEFGAFFVLQIELPRKAEQLLNLDEAAFAVGLERMDKLVTLRECERFFAQTLAQQAQVVHLLVNAKTLLAGQGQRCTLFVGH